MAKKDPQNEPMTDAEGAPEAAADLAEDAKEAVAAEEARDDATKVADVPAEADAGATKATAVPEDVAGDEAPKPKRRRRKKTDEDDAPEAAEAAAEEPAEEKKEKKEKPKRRRGSAETTTAAKPKPAPTRRAADGTVIVRAQAKYVRCAPRKARLVVDHIRGKSVEEARALLRHTTRSAAADVLKLLDSAVANAENNHELFADELRIHQAYVDEGPTIKRFRPRAQGRATRIRKRTSHLTVTLTPKE